jgi:chromosome segregation ATPase
VPDAFELEEFEYLPATAGTALVRVAGSWLAEDVSQPALLVRTPFGDDRVDPLPDSAGEPVTGAPWRAAFSLALHVITGGTAQFALDAGDLQVELPPPSERGAAGGFDRVAAGRELGELRAANERLTKRVAELDAEVDSSKRELKPRQARTVAKAKEEAERERTTRADMEKRLRVQTENAQQAQAQLAEVQVAARVAEAELERVSQERAVLEEKLSALLEEEGSARGAQGVLQEGIAELREERDALRAERDTLREELGSAQESARGAQETEAKLETAARRLAEAEGRAQEAEARAAEADKALEYARAAVAAAVASEAGDERAAAALEEARQEAEDARQQAALLTGEIEALKAAHAQALELVEARAEEAIAEVERRLAAEGSADASGRLAAAEREVAEAQKQAAEAERRASEIERSAANAVAEAERKLSEERERRASELGAVRSSLGEESDMALKKLERDLAQAKAESDRRGAEVAQLKRRTLRAEREAEEAKKARDRAVEQAKTGAKRPPRERQPRERPARRPAPVPVREIAVQEVGPPMTRRLQSVRQEEAAAREAAERVRNGGGASELEMVDAEAAVERAAEERRRLEEGIEAAREAVERTARSQLKRSSRGALREATTRLADCLAEGEHLLHLAGGGQRDARRLVAATNRRLLVLEGSDEDPEVLRYDEVDSVQAARRGTLQVSTKRGQFQVEQVSGDLDGLVQYVNQQIWDVLHRASGEAPS